MASYRLEDYVHESSVKEHLKAVISDEDGYRRVDSSSTYQAPEFNLTVNIQTIQTNRPLEELDYDSLEPVSQRIYDIVRERVEDDLEPD